MCERKLRKQESCSESKSTATLLLLLQICILLHSNSDLLRYIVSKRSVCYFDCPHIFYMLRLLCHHIPHHDFTRQSLKTYCSFFYFLSISQCEDFSIKLHIPQCFGLIISRISSYVSPSRTKVYYHTFTLFKKKSASTQQPFKIRGFCKC